MKFIIPSAFLIICSVVGIYQFFACKTGGDERVAAAYREKTFVLDSLFQNAGSKRGNKAFIRVFKTEKELELWVENTELSAYVLLKTYPICAASGELGRKLREGDRQVPEGCYEIAQYNPESSYWLSLGLNYPNDADKKVADPENPGSDIFIHGHCASIGCMAMTDDCIKEIYLVALEARKQANVSVYIFPFRMTETNLTSYAALMPQNADFWQHLQSIYSFLEEKKQIPIVKIEDNGFYSL